MDYDKYSSVKEALSEILRENQNYILIKHKAKKGHSINRHYHPKANEWLICDNGKFEIRIDDKREKFEAKRGVTVFKFMVAQKHAFTALSDISYFVVRDVDDDTVFSNSIF